MEGKLRLYMENKFWFLFEGVKEELVAITEAIHIKWRFFQIE